MHSICSRCVVIITYSIISVVLFIETMFLAYINNTFMTLLNDKEER